MEMTSVGAVAVVVDESATLSVVGTDIVSTTPLVTAGIVVASGVEDGPSDVVAISSVTL